MRRGVRRRMVTDQIVWSDDIRYIDSNSERISTSGGVYMILRNDGVKGYLSNVYAGKAKNLRDRFLEHLSDEEKNTCIKNNLKNKECYFRYTVIYNEVGRQELEDQLLRNGKYECNVQGQ